MNWQTYDATWLADLVKRQHPGRVEVWESLMKAKQYSIESKAYFHFVNPANANQKGSQWQFKENLLVQHPTHGDLILDVLEDDRVGGVEFLRYIL